MARNQKDPSCRQKNLLVPSEVCMRYERWLGLKTGEVPTKAQVMEINERMLDQIERAVRGIPLSSDDYRLLAEERAKEEAKFLAKQTTRR